tara:strand:- start:747 stop:1058 length:312 start_codon:yes stop_codon:yes gene_type:complete
MSIYELRIYTLYVGKINDAKEIYLNYGWPAIKKYEKNLVKYFIGDLGALNQIIHIWQFENDNNRRDVWNKIYADEEFLKFAVKFRPLVMKQENKLMTAAPWTP